jgi:ABC-type transport system involved in multi-copper enzyme maturation permease subunit
LILVFFFPVAVVFFSFVDQIPVFNVILDFPPRSLPLAERMYNLHMPIVWWAKIATGILTSVAIFAAAVRGAGTVSGEHDRDTWISLISAPLTSWEILRAKWLGCLFSLHRLYFVLVLVWGVAVATGSMQPIMVIPCLLTTLVLISAFSWIGIFCSVTARNTLVATIRSLMLSLFFGGGFWLVIMFCCAMPLGIILGGRAGGDWNIISQLGFVLMAGTPPYMAGWMPIYRFNSEEMGPFEGGFDWSFGPFSFVIALLFWGFFNILVGIITAILFAKQSNRLQESR